MEIKTNALKASWLPLMIFAFVFRVDSSEPTLLITRHNSGDIFAQVPDVATRCIEETCVGMSSGTAIAISIRDLCTCRCHSHLPAFREDLGICVDDIHECVLSPFVGGSTSQQIPFVYLPLRGQIIHPGKAISFTGIQTPVCAVSGAKYMTEDGWVDLRNPADSDVPFRIVRDEGRAFLQWSGEPELRNRMWGRLAMVNMMCREMSTTESTETPRVQMIFSPCVAFRVVGTPMKHLTNVSEVAFVQDSQTESSSITSEPMSVTEYVAIGICSVLLGLIYVASVFLYLHLRKRNKGNSGEKSGDDKSIRGIEEGIVKNNPLLSMPAHFIQGDQTYSDTNSSDNDAAPDIIKHYEDRKKQITAALVHPQNQKFSFNSHRPSFSSFELSHQDSATNERLPEENVSIVETLEGREERPDNIRALSGSTRKKLYFNPAYFEPHLLMAPPPAALEFLTKIREVISIAKQKLSSKRFTPSLINIPEEDNHYLIDPIYGFANPASRRNSNISLKRENSRRKTCTGCLGCDPQDLKSLSGKLPEFPSLAACHSCTMTSNESKQRSIRKWLEDVPVLKDSSEGSQSAVKPARCPKRVRSPTKSLPAEEYDGTTRALPPKPVENNSTVENGCNGNPPTKDLRKIRKPPPPPASMKMTQEENIYDTIAMEMKMGSSMQFPPPDMIQQAMEVERSEEKVATLTKEQMNAVINEFTIHKNLIIPYAESELLEKHCSPVDYETDSLERSGNKGYSTPSDYADVSSSQPSPSLSTVLPDQEEMTMRNAIYNKRTGNLTISKINMDILQEDDHDYELIVMKKGAIIDHGSYKLPELLQANNRYSFVSEVYVNSGYNYGSAPSTPGGSRYSTMDKKTLKVRYENGVEKPGKLLIEVEDCLDHYIPVHDSDEYEADTLDRKPSKNKIPDSSLKRENNQEVHPERPTQILLRTTGSFRSDAKTLVPLAADPPRSEPPEESNFNRVFGSLREIYEAKTKGSLFKEVDKRDCCTAIGDEEKGRTLTLEERHSRRQRAKGAIVQPDVIPPPPHGSSPVYEHNHPAREALEADDNNIKSPSKNSNGRSVGSKSTKSNAPTCNPTSTPSGTPEQPSEDYKLCLLQKSKKNGAITNLIQTEDVILKKDSNNNEFVLHSMLHPHAKKKKQPRPWNATMKPEDSGYLSSDSNESRSAKTKEAAVDHGSESDESLGDGHSESGAESVETHSVFFGRFPLNMALFRGYGSTDSGVIGGEEGPSSSDSENVSYTTVIPVTKT